MNLETMAAPKVIARAGVIAEKNKRTARKHRVPIVEKSARAHDV